MSQNDKSSIEQQRAEFNQRFDARAKLRLCVWLNPDSAEYALVRSYCLNWCLEGKIEANPQTREHLKEWKTDVSYSQEIKEDE
jgi:hypothetical protein